MIETNQAYHFPKTQEEKQELAKQLRKGDIVYAKYTCHFTRASYIDAAIVMLQRIAQAIFGKEGRAGHERMVHAAIVVDVNAETGQVLVSEAMPTGGQNDLRIVDFFKHHDLELVKDEPYEYHIFRANENSELAKITEKAASIAEKLGTKASYLRSNEPVEERKGKKHKFSFWRGLGGIFDRYWYGKDRTLKHVKRMFKQLADEQLRQADKLNKATGGSKPKTFFCSYFVAHALQQAELSDKKETIRALRGVKGGLAVIEQIEDEEVRKQFIRRWAKEMANEHFETMKQLKLETKFDPKSLAPQYLMHYLAKRTHRVVTVIPQV